MRLALAVATLCMWASAAFAQTPICQAHGVSVSVDFEGGGRHTCRIGAGGDIILAVTPEGAPINASPWYAFRLDAAAATPLRVTLDYGAYEHRYAPHITQDGQDWFNIAPSRVRTGANNHRVSIDLDLAAGPVTIAAQPIETSAAAQAWADPLLTALGFEAIRYGRSIDGAPLIAYRGGQGDLVVALTRQHPPETTGAHAFRAFVERIAAGNREAVAFRQSHRLLIVPMPNPDGVRRGHWRWNNGGVDLNRDWRDFTQPETRALRDLILTEAGDRRTVAFFDFHSTQHSAIYAPPLDAASATIDFLPLLRARLDSATSHPPRWSYSHSETGLTAKRWALSTLHAPGLTIEIADDATEADARSLGRAIADALLAYSEGVADAPGQP